MRTRITRGTRVALTAVALAGVVASGGLAACSSSTSGGAPSAAGQAASGPSAASASAPVSDVHNGADIAFATGMIPHHRQAVVMSSLAADRAASPEVIDLAGRIAAEQGPEIERMNAMLDAWGAPPPPEDMAAHGGMAMQGMLTGDQLGALGAQSGPAFDRMFLELMIEHHTGAVQMARAEQAQGGNPQALELAASIIGAQEREIAEMQDLLTRV